MAVHSADDLMGRARKAIVPLLIATLAGVHMPVIAAQSVQPDGASTSQVPETTSLSVSVPVPIPPVSTATPHIKPGALERQIAAEAERIARTSQTSGSGNTPNAPHSCGWGVAALALGVLWDVAVIVDPKSYKDPNVRGFSAPLSTSGAVSFSLATVVALVGLYEVVTHCGGSSNSTASSSGAQPIQQAPATEFQDSGAREAIDEIRAGSHGDIPPPQATGRCSGAMATVSIQNQTTYALSVYLAGPDSHTLTMNPGGSTSVRLTEGHYDIGARVAAPHVAPFSGGWDLGRGCPYASQFYIGAPGR